MTADDIALPVPSRKPLERASLVLYGVICSVPPLWPAFLLLPLLVVYAQRIGGWGRVLGDLGVILAGIIAGTFLQLVAALAV